MRWRAPPEPGELVRSWGEPDFLWEWLGRPARLTSVIALVDPGSAARDFFGRDLLKDRGWSQAVWDTRSVADLIAEQIEPATSIVLTDEVTDPSLREWIAVLNPSARCIDGANADAVAASLWSESMRWGEEPPLPVVPPWLPPLKHEDPVVTDAGWPGSVVVFKTARPFVGERLRRWLAEPPRGLLRGKGSFWVDEHWDRRFGYSCAGAVQRWFHAGGWWASHAPGRWPACPEERRLLLDLWHPRFGDRRQHFAFVGRDLDERRILGSLEDCLSRPEIRMARPRSGLESSLH